MKLRELIFSQPHWDSKSLWESIRVVMGGKTVYIPKILASKEIQLRNEIILRLFHFGNKSVHQLAKDFNLSVRRIRQVVYSENKEGK